MDNTIVKTKKAGGFKSKQRGKSLETSTEDFFLLLYRHFQGFSVLTKCHCTAKRKSYFERCRPNHVKRWQNFVLFAPNLYFAKKQKLNINREKQRTHFVTVFNNFGH